jgi:murein hydrolase activator
MLRCTSILLLLFWMVQAHAQKSRTELEREKQRNRKKLEETSKILNETKEKQQATLGQLSALNEKISLQEAKIRNIGSELRLLDADILENNEVVEAMEEDLKMLKKEYGAMVYATSKVKYSDRFVVFLFTAETFKQLHRRLNYLRFYAEARRKQVAEIKKVTEALLGQQKELNSKRLAKKTLLNSEYMENTTLQGMRTEQAELVQKLKKKEKELNDEIKSIRKANSALEKLIADLIKSEIRKSTKVRNADKISLTPEAGLVSRSFSGNKSKLIWPVENGFISSRFGKQSHPVLRNVVIDNLGVKIQTNRGEKVRAVFDGVVGSIASIQGSNLVTIQHGDYFTVYSNLKSIQVKAGQKIKMKEVIGEVQDHDGIAEVQFQIWNNMERLDPQSWLLGK